MSLKIAFATVLASLAMAGTAWALPTNEELKIGISQEFDNFNPLIGSMVASTYMSGLCIQQFVMLTPDGKWIPQLVKSIPTLENKGAKIIPGDKPGLVSTWEIRDAAQWGDGQPVTCDDVKFAWEAGKNNNVLSSTLGS